MKILVILIFHTEIITINLLMCFFPVFFSAYIVMKLTLYRTYKNCSIIINILI